MSAEHGTALLKDTNFIPGGVLISKLVTNRAKEIQELEKLVAQSSGSKLVFQRLPKHLRRRAMSHHVKRLPRKVRLAHSNQMIKSGLPPLNKRPSRKFRRRPKNLVVDYNRRQREHVWLETHIWHAKRFRMVNRWGYRLAFKPNDKAFRACYRASAHHCLLQDISYISCVQISGAKSVIINNFKMITNSSTGLSIGAQAFVNGNREGDIMIYKKNFYPFGAIGEVKYMWKPVENNENNYLWLWIHPAFYTELLNNLQDTFELNKLTLTNNTTGIILTELKHNLNRFRLTGPLAHSVIQKLETPSQQNMTPWFKKYLTIEQNSNIFNDQSTYWNDLNNANSTAELSPHLILNLIVTDPRYSWPSKRTKAIKQTLDFEPPETPKTIKFGQIWCPKTRAVVSEKVLNTSQLIEKRKNNLVPSKNVPLDTPAIPIMLVQQPGQKDNNFASGWDIILPSNWGRPFWFNFIMWGARAGGLRESNSLLFEQGLPEFQPDTQSGQAEETRTTQLYKDSYFRLPPNKRTNYTKFGVFSPFNFPWTTLIEEWNQQKVTNFYVMRDKQQLKLLQELLSKNITTKLNFTENCLVPVKLKLVKRGKVGKFSMICLPQETDYKTEPTEPKHTDQNQKIRKDIRDAHKILLRKLKRHRFRARQKGEQPSSSKQTVEEQLEKIKNLWLPETDKIRRSCSREILGLVTAGDFSLTSARGQCVGYVTLAALNVLSGKSGSHVLVRDTRSKQYRFAELHIICS